MSLEKFSIVCFALRIKEELSQPQKITFLLQFVPRKKGSRMSHQVRTEIFQAQ